MNILSYRGPGKAGGVSGALSRIVNRTGGDAICWWYLNEGKLQSRIKNSCSTIFGFPDEIVEGHYRYCNNFLWPVMHDMPERAFLNPSDKLCYQQFNRLFGLSILRQIESQLMEFFVQDYQLALLPPTLGRFRESLTSTFLHIPWPKSVERAHRSALIEVAEGLLASRKLGFHIEEYALNFLNFVRLYLPHYEVDFDTRQVIAIKRKLRAPDKSSATQIVVLPLGIDVQFWREIVSDKPVALDRRVIDVCSSTYILSVDRADYTKGILQRIAAIDHLFETRPELKGNITFVQVCQPSRIGLPLFDKYWQQTQEAMQDLNCRWRHGKWEPLVWVSDPVQPVDLAWLYANATAMLVSPLRDGLNLTAKEFVTCAKHEDSILLLSPQAGVWQEVSDLAMAVNAQAPVVAAQQIGRSLMLSRREKVARMQALKARVEANPLELWWTRLTAVDVPPETTANGMFVQVDLDGTRVS
jgi:trehalose 6-phosphate synthase/phosphatase